MHERTEDTRPAPAHHHGDGEQARRPCVDCRRPLWHDEADRYACRPCQARATRRLTELADLYARLNTATALNPAAGGRRGEGGGTPNAGRAHAPLPVRVDVLDLTAPGGITTRLQAIVDSWRTALGWTIRPLIDNRRVYPYWRDNITRAFPRHISFLTANLEWACTTYPEVGYDLAVIHHAHRAATIALDPAPPGRTGRVHIGSCPTPGPDGTPCGTSLTADTATRTATCRSCGTTWEGDDALRALRSAQRALHPGTPELAAA